MSAGSDGRGAATCDPPAGEAATAGVPAPGEAATAGVPAAGEAPTAGVPAAGVPARGTVVLVATPIGNLGDLSRRALEALAGADVVCCEDTRRTRALLTAMGVPGAGRLLSLHAHNEAARIPELLAALAAGKSVAVVSDAGTPAVSDPGARLVRAAIDAGVPVTSVPGASSVLAALVVSGLATERFCVEGFLPRKGSARRARLESIVADERTTVVLEAPGRLAATLGDLAALAPQRPVAVCRELTKLHEEVWRGTAVDAAGAFSTRQVRGEVVVVVGGAGTGAGESEDADTAAAARDREVALALEVRLARGETTRDAADAVAAALGVSRRRAYEAALGLRKGGPAR